MKPVQKSGAGLIVLAIGGTLALNYPLLSLFDHDISVFGIPLPFIYLLVVWTLLIGGIAVLAERVDGNDVSNNVHDSSGPSESQSSGPASTDN